MTKFRSLTLLTMLCAVHGVDGILRVLNDALSNSTAARNKTFETQPAPFGAPFTSTVIAYVKFLKEYPTLCKRTFVSNGIDLTDELSLSSRNSTKNETISSMLLLLEEDEATRTLLEEEDDEEEQNEQQQQQPIPVALLAENGVCHINEKAEVASLFYPIVQYLIIQSDDDRLFPIMLKKTEEFPIGIILTTNEAGQVLKGSYSPGEPEVLVEIAAADEPILFAREKSRLQKFLSDILPKVWCILSMLGSGYIICSLLVGRKRRNNNSRTRNMNNMKSTFNRLLLALSICDFFYSFVLLLGSLPVPKYPQNNAEYQWILGDSLWKAFFPDARGNQTTCTMQGFFNHFFVMGSVLFTGCIAIQFLLLVRYNWKESQMRKAEIVFFFLAIFIPLVTAVAATAQGLMHPSGTGTCWLAEDPFVCELTDTYPLLSYYCDKYKSGDYTLFTYWAFCNTIWVVLTILIVLYAMIMMFLTVRHQEQRAAAIGSQRAIERKSQKEVLAKGMLYIGAFCIVWIPVVVSHTLMRARWSDSLVVLIRNLLPLQGILNVIIYSMPIESCFNALSGCCCCNASKKNDTIIIQCLKKPNLQCLEGNAVQGFGNSNENDQTIPV